MTLQTLEEKGLFVMNQWKKRRKLRQEKFVREQNDLEFMQQLAQAKQNLQIARDNFNTTTDSELMEYYIYMIKAEETKLNYYLSLAKKESRKSLSGMVQRFQSMSDRGWV